MKKRIFSAILCFCIAANFIPSFSFAEGNAAGMTGQETNTQSVEQEERDTEESGPQTLDEENIDEELICEDSKAKPSLKAELSGNLNENTRIFKAAVPVLNAESSGFGEAVELSSDLDLSEGAELSFELSKENEARREGVSDTYIICRYDEEGFHPLETTEKDEKNISAVIRETGIFFVMNSDIFLKNLGIDLSEISAEVLGTAGNSAESAGMQPEAAYRIRLKGTFQAVDLVAKPAAGSSADTDGDGVTDVKELKSSAPEACDLKSYILPILKKRGISWDDYIANGGTTETFVYDYYSDPAAADTDGDGLTDDKDESPRVWDVCDRDLVMFSALTYDTKENYNNRTVDNYYYFYDFGSIDEVADSWSIADCTEEVWVDVATHFYAAAYKNGNDVIIAFRGTDGENSTDGEWGEWFNNVIGVGIFNYHPEEYNAVDYVRKIVERYSDCNIYITGHSLGGYLAQIAASEIIENYPDVNLKKVVYFNGIGLKYNKLLFWMKNDVMENLKSYDNGSNLIAYKIKGDFISAIGTHSCKMIACDVTEEAMENHKGKYGSGFWTDLFSRFAAKCLCMISSENVTYYYDKYKVSSMVEYFWITHENNSFFHHLTQGTRDGSCRYPENSANKNVA